MFELGVALKYLLPRRRQLSVSIIALLSVLVIALVVWLVIVFLSVTRGIEQRWMKSLVALNAPLRLTPTDAYYNSYYYLVDQYSLDAGYSLRTIGEKLRSEKADPYDPEFDPELPTSFPQPDYLATGRLKDPVHGAFAAIEKLEGFGQVRAREFELGLANLRLRLLRPRQDDPLAPMTFEQSFTSQAVYLGSFDGGNPALAETLLPPEPTDLTHQLELLSLSVDNVREEAPTRDLLLSPRKRAERLEHFLSHLSISALQTGKAGWVLPRSLYPASGMLTAEFKDGHLFLMPDSAAAGEGGVTVSFSQPPALPLIVPEGVILKAALDPHKIATLSSELLFDVEFNLQGQTFKGKVPYEGLAIAKATPCCLFPESPNHPPPWRHAIGGSERLPRDPEWGEGVLLPKVFHDQGVRLGDRGYLAYYASTPSSVGEQRLPIYAAGFYDPGFLPIGSRYVLVNPAVIADVRSSINHVEQDKANGINVWIEDLKRVEEAKTQLLAALEAAGLLPYWKLETFKEYDFAKPLVQQFDSDRNLLSLIAIIVITVACSNIISMLIVLVNDKRKEIGILRSMGATAKSIAAIFAVCGMVMGISGSLLGIGAAYLTLANLDRLVAVISAIQGHEAFHAAFYGASLPHHIDGEVLTFVITATALVSLFAGLVPAVKAAILRPAVVLRAE